MPQAKQLYEQLAKDEAHGEVAARSLLALGRISWPIENPRQLGKGLGTADAQREAAERFRRIKQGYPSSTVAAEALWRLALIELEPDSPLYETSDALADLTSLRVQYPDSLRRPQALVLEARLRLAAGRDDLAAGLAFERLSRWPERVDGSADAWEILAWVDWHAGREGEALVEWQRAARAEPNSSSGKSAAATIQLADRLRWHKPQQLSVVAMQSLELKAIQLSIDQDGDLLGVAPRDDQRLTLSSEHKLVQTRSPGIVAANFDPWGRPWLLAERKLETPAGTVEWKLPAEIEPGPFVIASPRTIWMIDQRESRVVRLSPEGKIELAAQLIPRSAPLALALTPQGNLLVLDENSPSLQLFAPDGKLLLKSPIGTPKPVAIAVDRFGSIYLLDSRLAQVTIADAQGKAWATVPLPHGPDIGMEKPTALAVDPAGTLVVFDSKQGRLAWLR